MSPLVLFAPGAGLPSTSPWMVRWTERLRSLPAEVVTFDYPYQRAGRKRPDRHEVLVAAHRAALAEARARHPDRPVVLAGKSMGSRMGCHLCVEVPEEPVRALICFGYPLVGASGAVRDEVLVALRTPILFLQGTRDPLAPLDALAAARARMAAPSALHVVESGDHSLEITRAESRVRSQDEHDDDLVAAIRAFLRAHLPEDP